MCYLISFSLLVDVPDFSGFISPEEVAVSSVVDAVVMVVEAVVVAGEELTGFVEPLIGSTD